ncbi:SLC13 family permease [uncultured Dysosmobacter sp.]|uniref:SLC13 family permease n=1 Tax=uncultured Dysosmobacter sp. TaxID=2591384 RepID=UPI00262FF4FC|nr:SLC13 family permease [uncultured Dysosmobacter sp.]
MANTITVKKNGTEVKKYSPIYWFHIAVTLFFMFGFGFIPPFATLTPVGMRILGVFLGVVYGYSTCDIIWPSFFAFLAYGTSGFVDMNTAVGTMMGHPVVFQSLVSFISAGALTYYGFGKWFVRKTLSMKIFKGRPLFYTWCFMVIFGLSAIVVNQIMLQILLYAIWDDIADNCGYPKNSSFRYVGFGGILLGTILGGAMIPYTSWMLGLSQTWAAVTGSPINFGIMGSMTIPATVLILTVYVFATKVIFKVDYSTMEAFDVNKMDESSKHLSHRTRRILILNLTTIFIVILASTLLGTAFSDFVLNVVTVGGAFCICAALLLLLPSGEGDGKPCIEFNAVKENAISWPVLLMCAVTLPIAGAVTNEATGIVPWLTGVFTPLFEGHSGIFILIFTIVLSMFLTNVGSNIAFGAAMIPIIAPFVIQSGMDPQFAGAALIYIINIGMVLPGASAPAAIFHAREELTNGGMRIKVTLAGALSVLVVAIPLFSMFAIFLG